MNDEKVQCMKIASLYEEEYWDGDRRFGYGGYSYDGRWESTAKELITKYKLTSTSKVLDIGCGMGHLIYEIKKILDCEVQGLDISEYAKNKSIIGEKIKIYDVQDGLNYNENEFDLVLSIMTLHNFPVHKLHPLIKDIEKIGKEKFIAVESFRSDVELFNLQCWALTCQSFLSPESWQWIFNESGYTGDFEFLYFE